MALLNTGHRTACGATVFTFNPHPAYGVTKAMKIIDYLRVFREDGTLNLLINMGKFPPIIIEHIAWMDYYEAEIAKGNYRARHKTINHFAHCNLPKFKHAYAFLTQTVSEKDYVKDYEIVIWKRYRE